MPLISPKPTPLLDLSSSEILPPTFWLCLLFLRGLLLALLSRLAPVFLPNYPHFFLPSSSLSFLHAFSHSSNQHT